MQACNCLDWRDASPSPYCKKCHGTGFIQSKPKDSTYTSGIWGMKGALLLQVGNSGVVRVAEDTVLGTYSIGLRTSEGMDWKPISKQLYDLLIKELSN